jgi:Arc/MetJ-type ribon-helix-helix transcriptional regulator
MTISLSAETQKLLEERMKAGGFPTADDAVRAALQRMAEHDAWTGDEIDDETWAAIERAEAQYQRGEGIPVDEAFERIRRKHFGV